MSKCPVIIPFSWVENKTVAIRLNKILDDKLYTLGFLFKIKAAILEKLPYTQSRIGSQTDASKVSFFEHRASIIEPYLKRYQTDKPMVPFIYYDVKDIVCETCCFTFFQG